MATCYGTSLAGVQADCGRADAHGEHRYSEAGTPVAEDSPQQTCLGAPAGFEAECGAVGPHDAHSMNG